MSGSGGVDTSIYQTIKAPPAGGGEAGGGSFNPLAMAQGYQQLQRTSLENNQMAQQQQARLAIGQAAQQAIDPTTGEMDNKKLVGLISQDPRAAFMAQDVQNAITAREFQQQQIHTSVLENGMKVAEAMTGQLGTLIDDPALTRQKVFSVLQNYTSMAPQGALPIAMKFLAGMPKDDSPASQDTLRNMLIQSQSAFKNTFDTLHMAHPDMIPVNSGGKITFMSPSGLYARQGQTGISMPMTPSPEVGAREVGQVIGPDGSPRPVTGYAAFAAAQGQAGASGGGANPAGWGQGPVTGAPGQAPSPGQANPQAQQASSPSAQAPSPSTQAPIWNPESAEGAGSFNPAQAYMSGEGAKALSPGQHKAQEKNADVFNTQRTALSTGIGAGQQVVQAMNYEEQLSSLLKTGPGAGTSQKLGTLLQGLGNIFPDLGKHLNLQSTGAALMANPNDPATVAQATAAAQALKSQILNNTVNQFKGAFGSQGTENEYNSLVNNYISENTSDAARAQIFNTAKQKLGFEQAQAAAAGSYAKAHAGDKLGPDWNEFLPEFTTHSQKYGFGATGVDTKAVVAPIGDTQGLLNSVGMHPESNNPDAVPKAKAPTTKASFVHGTAHGVTGTFQRLGDGTMKLVSPD